MTGQNVAFRIARDANTLVQLIEDHVITITALHATLVHTRDSFKEAKQEIVKRDQRIKDLLDELGVLERNLDEMVMLVPYNEDDAL